MRGAHRGVWCSKIQHLMEAELFAAERRRSAPSGRALSCAAVDARKIQGSSATYKRKDARNRAPVIPVSLHISDVSAQRKVWGVKRGQETIGVLSPFVSAARRRHPRPPKAATVHAHLERKVASGGGYTVRRRYRDKKAPAAWENCRGRYCSAVRAHTHFYGERGRTALRTGNS